jgi:hypothetical protein
MASATRPWLSLLLPLTPLACGGEPPPPPVVPVAMVAPSAAPLVVAAPPEAPARWVRSDGATRVGPTFAEGTLVLVGGRRVLVRPDGSSVNAAKEAPEPLLHVIAVPTEGADVLVGASLRGLYRLAGALGEAVPIARLDVDIEHLGTAPGLVAVWDVAGGEPRFVDVTSGVPKPGPALPLAARDLAFSSAKEGAAVFVGAGLAVTSDGGAHFRPVTGTSDEALRVAGLRRRGAALAAFVYEDGLEAPVDTSAATLGAMVEPPRGKEEGPLLRWVRATSRDPLEAAASGGIRDDAGNALVASHGLVARVSLATGELLELVGLGPLPTGTRCGSGKRGDMALFACSLPPEEEGDLYDPFGVVMVPLRGKLAPERPVVARNAESELRVGSAGGVMLFGACTTEEEGDACVRQPDGKWKTLAIGQDLFERGAGPLADGRVAFVRGMFEGDEAEVPPEGAPRPDLGYPSPYVVAVDGSGVEKWLAGSSWQGRSSGPLNVLSGLDEGPDGALHFALANDEGAFVFALPAGRSVAPTRVEGARDVRLHGERALAVGPGRFAVSVDGGHTFSEPSRAPTLLEEAERVAASGDANELAVSDVGLRLGGWLRLGWGNDVVPPEVAALPELASLPARPSSPPRGPAQVLTCKKAGKLPTSTAFVPSPDELTKLLGIAGAAPKGLQRGSSPLAPTRSVDASALLVEEGPAAKASKPAKWTLSWLDPMEVGGAVHRVVLVPPEGAAWGAQLREIDVRGGRALAVVRSGGKSFLVRAGFAGKAAIVKVETNELPQGEVIFGEGPSAPLFWSRNSGVFVFAGDEPPRPFVALASSSGRVLGDPVAAGLPVLLSAGDWSRVRFLEVPKKAPAAARATPLPLDGWAPAPSFRRDLGRFAACGARPAGTRFVLQQSYMDLELDGQKRTLRAVVALRVQGEEVCVESMAGFSASSSRVGALFVRADFSKKKGEGSLDAAVREHLRLDCSLSPKR